MFATVLLVGGQGGVKLCDVHQKAIPGATREPAPAAVHVCVGRCHRAECTDARGTTAPPSRCAGLGDAGATVTISVPGGEQHRGQTRGFSEMLQLSLS